MLRPDTHRTMRTFRYGSLESQEADLYLPGARRPPVVVLLHGGFWRIPYGRGEMTAVARDLVDRGFAVWNLEYRRMGESGGGWPGTLEDVIAGIDCLAALAAEGTDLDLDCVTVVGHSAGGHLALLVAAHGIKRLKTAGSPGVRPLAAAGLAPIADLAGAYRLASGNHAVEEFLGGSPQQQPDRYETASPIALVPLGVKQLIVHGTADEVLPVDLSRAYVRTAVNAGDIVDLIEMPGLGHMEFLNPGSAAHAALCRWLTARSKTVRFP